MTCPGLGGELAPRCQIIQNTLIGGVAFGKNTDADTSHAVGRAQEAGFGCLTGGALLQQAHEIPGSA